MFPNPHECLRQNPNKDCDRCPSDIHANCRATMLRGRQTDQGPAKSKQQLHESASHASAEIRRRTRGDYDQD